MTGEKTSVYKPLLSAGDVTKRTRALVGRKRWLHHPKGLTNSDSNALVFSKEFCEQHSWNGAIDLTKERGVYNLYVQVAGGDGSVERAVDVIGGASAGEPVRPSEMGVPSDGGEEAVAPRVPKPTQAEQDEHYAAGHAAYRSWCEHCVKGRGRASPQAVVSEGELPEVGVDYAYLGPEKSQVTILVCKCKRTRCLAATQVREKGMNVAARFGMETIVVEVRQ